MFSLPRKIIRSLVALAALTVLAIVAVAQQRPNIVFLYTDDQAAWTIGELGNRQSYTPNLDRLFREGARLTNAFTTTPVCSPSRATLMSSRYGTELGITDYLSHGVEPSLGLDPSNVIWPKVLSQAGYATALFGKWHLGQLDRYHPTRFGYDQFTGFRVGAGISKDPPVEIDGQVRTVEGYTPDILINAAIDYIRGRDTERPFLVNVHFWAPHANTANATPSGDRTWLPLSDQDWARFRDLDPDLPGADYPKLDIPRAKRMMREYLASVASVDRNVGRLLKVLDELDLAENTIVIFSSDHGYNLSHHGIWHKGNGRWLLTDNQGHRPNMFDHSLRVPAAVRWPAVIKPATVVEETVTNLDWYPTILGMAGAAVPPGQKIRGRSFLPLLQGKSLDWENEFYAEYKQYHAAVADQRVWRTPEWKLIVDFHNPGHDELFHLAVDPEEKHNLIGTISPQVQQAEARLRQQLMAKLDELGGVPQRSP
jgi:uncharacterized sulfatase